jgi:hypothetical protein
MIIYIDPGTEAIVYRSPAYTNINGVIGHYTIERAQRDVSLQGLDHSNLLMWETKDLSVAEQLASVPHDHLIATIQNGSVTNVALAPPPPTLYVHVTLTGGIQSPAGTLYLKNDGVDALQVHAELRDGPEATSNAVTQLGGNDIDGMWALELVNVDTSALADAPLVQMSAGVIDVSYNTTIAPCEVALAEDRLQPIGGYQLKLTQPVRFKIVRTLN